MRTYALVVLYTSVGLPVQFRPFGLISEETHPRTAPPRSSNAAPRGDVSCAKIALKGHSQTYSRP